MGGGAQRISKRALTSDLFVDPKRDAEKEREEKEKKERKEREEKEKKEREEKEKKEIEVCVVGFLFTFCNVQTRTKKNSQPQS